MAFCLLRSGAVQSNTGRGLGTIFPLSGCGVNDPKELVVGHGFWVEVRPHRSALHVLIGPLERSHHLTLPGPRIPNHKDRVTHRQQLLQLHHLTHTHTQEKVPYSLFTSRGEL